MGVPKSELFLFWVLQTFLQFLTGAFEFIGDLTPNGVVWVAFLCTKDMFKLHAFAFILQMLAFEGNDMVQFSFGQYFVTLLEVVAGAIVIVLFSSNCFFLNNFFLTGNNIVLFQLLAALVDMLGDIFWC